MIPRTRRAPRPKKIIKRNLESYLDWGLKEADTQFSLWIRNRDGKCIRCGATKETGAQLQNSHYWGRIRKNTRYDPENCDTLCATCHYWGDSKRGIIAWEEEKQGAYMRFKLEQLGKERFDALEVRAHTDTKNNIVIKQCQEFLATQVYKGKPKYLSLLSPGESARPEGI